MLFLFIHSSMVMFHVIITISSGSWLMECSDETLSIFWKNAFMKNEEFLKWNSWKKFFFSPTVCIFDFCYEENKCDNKVFRCPTILQPFQFDPEQKKACGNGHKKEPKHIHTSAANKHIHASAANKHIHASAADLLHIGIGNLNWCKCGHCKNEAREIGCLCCWGVDVVLIASTKIPEREGSILLSSFYWSAKEASCYPAFIGVCATFSHMC